MDLDPSLLTQGGLSGLLAFGFLAMMRRWLVTGAELKESKAERDLWQQSARTSSATVAELSGHVGRLADATQRLIAQQERQPQPWYPAATGRHAGPDYGPGWSDSGERGRPAPPPSSPNGMPNRRY